MLVAACCLLVAGCRPEVKTLPIPEEALVPLLADIHLAEARITEYYGAQKDSLAQLYYDKIYKIHEIGSEQFDSTMSILRADPDRMNRIYTQVLDTLAVRGAGVQ